MDPTLLTLHCARVCPSRRDCDSDERGRDTYHVRYGNLYRRDAVRSVPWVYQVWRASRPTPSWLGFGLAHDWANRVSGLVLLALYRQLRNCLYERRTVERRAHRLDGLPGGAWYFLVLDDDVSAGSCFKSASAHDGRQRRSDESIMVGWLGDLSR